MSAIFLYFVQQQDQLLHLFFLLLLSCIAIAIGSFLNVVIVRLPELIQNKNANDPSSNVNDPSSDASSDASNNSIDSSKTPTDSRRTSIDPNRTSTNSSKHSTNPNKDSIKNPNKNSSKASSKPSSKNSSKASKKITSHTIFRHYLTIIKSLCFPPSHCLHCKQRLAIYDLIPIISYYQLAAQCRSCKTAISFRYPLVEILTLLLSILAVIRFEFSLQLAPALLLIWALIVLAFIDIERLILPNCITLPFAGLGLIINFLNILLPFQEALLGMIFGYTFLWFIYYGYKILTTKDALGFGDIKLLAMLGAWLGWKILPWMILLASIVGVTWGCILMIQGRANKDTPLPFGACLAFAGIIALLFS